MKLRVFTLLGIVLFTITCSEDQTSDNSVPFLKDSTVSYILRANTADDLTSLDIYTLPQSTTLSPVIIWVHGGAWLLGDKKNNITDKINLTREIGSLLVSVNYRLSPSPVEITNPNRVKHPDHIEDVAEAVNWIVENIRDYGGDPDQMVIMGHSAGAQIISLLSTDNSYLQAKGLSPTIFRGVIPLDTEAFEIEPKVLEGGTTGALFRNAFGNDASTWASASATLQIEPNENIPKKWFLVERGSEQRRATLKRFINALNTTNTSITTVDAGVYTHSEINEKIGVPNETILTPRIKAFIEDCFSN